MPKYLVQAAYTAEGLKGLQKDKASGRKQATTHAVVSASILILVFDYVLTELFFAGK